MNWDQFESRIRVIGRAFLFYLLLVVLLIPISIGISLFTIFYSLAILGPWLSGKISLKSRFRSVIDWIFDIDKIHNFRDDLKDILGKHSNVEINDRSATEIREEIIDIHDQARTQAERGEFIVAIIIGPLSLVLGTLTGTSVIGWLLGSYSFIMTLTIGVHVVVLDILAYGREDDLSPYRREHLILLEGWNRAILSSRQNQARVLLIGSLHRLSPFGYELAKDVLDKVLDERMGPLEAISFTVFMISGITSEIIRKGDVIEL